MAQKKKEAKKEQQVPAEVKELMSRKQIETVCTIRAWHDEDFRKALLADPKSVLEKVLKIKFPAAMKVTIVEEKANEIRVSLPVKPAAAGELSDEQLEAVAGGRATAEENLGRVGRWFDDNFGRDDWEALGRRETWENLFRGW